MDIDNSARTAPESRTRLTEQDLAAVVRALTEDPDLNRLGFDAASFLEEDAHHVQALPRRAA